MKRLLLTCTDLMAIQFLVPHVKYLSQNGFSVELACSDVGGRIEELREILSEIAKIRTVRLVRSPFSAGNLKGYSDLKKIINSEHWDVIWTNEPVMGVMTRLAAQKARRSGTKVIYMAHGFHFYKGAPKLNWMIYYPVEKFCSRLCDMIITINNEDFERAKKFHTSKVEKINGIGVDTQKFSSCNVDRNLKRKELQIPQDAFFILSVGELQHNKNHEVVVRAIAELNNNNIHYGICGKGELFSKLKNLANQLGVENQIHFWGYRRDVAEILHSADLFAHPSIREGLPRAVMEAMANAKPVICSDIRGNTDLIDPQSGLVLSNNPKQYAQAIRHFALHPELCNEIGCINKEKIKKFDLKNVKNHILSLINLL